MKLNLKLDNGKPQLVLDYEEDEWKTLEEKLIRLGLKKTITNNGFSQHLTYEYFRQENAELTNFVFSKCHRINADVIDDINEYFLLDNHVNISIFRICPTGSKVFIPLDKFITIVDLRTIVDTLSTIYKALFEIVTQAEIKVNFKEKDVDYKL